MKRVRFHRIGLAAGVVLPVLALLVPGCQSPTDVRLVIKSLDIRCESLLGDGQISIALGPHGSVSTTSIPVTSTIDCTDNVGGTFAANVGDLAITPAGADNSDVDIVVVAHTTSGDIIQSRAVSFVPGTELQLLTILSIACVNVKCTDPGTTCHPLTGMCVSDGVTCEGTTCALPGETYGADAATPSDASKVISDAPSSPDQSSPPPDTSSPEDSSSGTDGESDAGADDSGFDAGMMSGKDAGTDSGFDAGIDSGIDAGVDSGFDSGMGMMVDAGMDSGQDSGMASGLDAGMDADADSGADADADTGSDADADADADSGGLQGLDASMGMGLGGCQGFSPTAAIACTEVNTSATCDPSVGEACCAMSGGVGGCTTDLAGCSTGGGTPFCCAQRSDCADSNDYCCTSLDSTGGFCVSDPAMCPSPNDYILCETSNDCPNAGKCIGVLPQGFQVCE